MSSENPIEAIFDDDPAGDAPAGDHLNAAALEKNFGIVEGDVTSSSTSMHVSTVVSDEGKQDSKQYSLVEYAQNNFLLHRRRHRGGMKDVTPAKILTHSKSLLQPLHKKLVGDDSGLHQGPALVTLNCFKWLQRFIYGTDKKAHIKALHKFVAEGLKGNELVRDELFCLIVKQSRIDPPTDHTARIVDHCWRVITVCAGVFPCSHTLAPYLLSYLSRAASQLTIARSCLEQLNQSLAKGPRKYPAMTFEINAVLEERKVGLEVETMAGHQEKVGVTSQMTVLEFTEVLARKLVPDGKLPVMNNTPCFSLFDSESKNGAESRLKVIPNNAFVMDVLAGWMLQETALKEVLYRNKGNSVLSSGDEETGLVHKLIFKQRFFFYYLLKRGSLSPESTNLVYEQGVKDITHFQYPCSETQAYEFAALQLIAEKKQITEIEAQLVAKFENYLPRNHVNALLGIEDHDDDHDNNFSPKSVVADLHSPHSPGSSVRKKKLTKHEKAEEARLEAEHKVKKEQVAKVIAKQYSALAARIGGDSEEAKRLYLDNLLKLPTYGMSEYEVTWLYDVKVGDWNYEANQPFNHYVNSNSVKEAKHYRLGISEKGVLFISTTTKKLRKHHPLCTIAKCDHDDELFSYHWGDPSLPDTHENSQRILVFKTPQAKQMCYVLNTYQRRPGFQLKFDH